jgi:hypothetical protein
VEPIPPAEAAPAEAAPAPTSAAATAEAVSAASFASAATSTDNFFFAAFARALEPRIVPAFLIFAVMLGKPLLIKNYTRTP